MITIARLPQNQIARAARLLARAFAADPIITHFLFDPERRKAAFPAFFRALLWDTFECRHVYAALSRQRLVGVAVWIPPSGAAPSRVFQWRATRNHGIVRARFGRRAAALYRGFEVISQEHPAQPHWYLCFIGVEPGFQGQGVGSKLLAPILRTADRDGTLCYLETPFPETHEFYRRHGFRLRSPTNPFAGAPPLWTMLRKPAKPAPAG